MWKTGQVSNTNVTSTKCNKICSNSTSKKLFSFDLKSEALQEFKLITKIYFDQKLEKEYKIEELF